LTEEEQELPKSRIFCGLIKKNMESFEECNDQCVSTEKEVEQLRNNLSAKTDKDLYFGRAFVVFEKQSTVERLLQTFETSMFETVVQLIKHKLCNFIVNSDSDFYFDGRKVTGERAPEPTDVHWENLNIKFKVRLKRTISTYCATALLLGAVFGVNYGLSSGKESLESSARNDKSGSSA
jgi:hypothetical protein